jgi:hypothetical protein
MSAISADQVTRRGVGSASIVPDVPTQGVRSIASDTQVVSAMKGGLSTNFHDQVSMRLVINLIVDGKCLPAAGKKPDYLWRALRHDTVIKS